MTFRNCPNARTSEVSLGKYTSWCFGGSRETLVSLPMVRGVVEKGLAVRRGGVVL